MSDILHELTYKDETGEIYLEYHPYYGVIMHCYALKWNKATALHYWTVWEKMLAELSNQGYDKIYAMVDNPKLKKFALMYGFESTGVTLMDEKSIEREVMVCSI